MDKAQVAVKAQIQDLSEKVVNVHTASHTLLWVRQVALQLIMTFKHRRVYEVYEFCCGTLIMTYILTLPPSFAAMTVLTPGRSGTIRMRTESPAPKTRVSRDPMKIKAVPG